MAGSDFQEWTVSEPYLNLHCKLGEGPYYEEATNSLRFVDIINKRIHTASLTEGPDSVTTLQLDTPVTVTADVQGLDPKDKILIGAKYGIALLDRKTGQYEYVSKFAAADNDRLRSNDGGVDPHGRFWLGAMTDFGKGDVLPEGGIYLFDSDKPANTRKVVSDMEIPNTISWSPDNKTLYYTDSTGGTVYAYDYAAETDDGSSVSNRRVFYKHDGTGGPDGHRIDRDGNMWHTIYGESRVLKLSPGGKLIGQINLPTKNITCCEFVGTELYITTANDDEGEGRSKELGGALFKVDVGTTGLKPFKFRMGS